MIRDRAAEALAQAEFFDICDDDQLRMLAFAGDQRHFAPGEVLYRAGEMPQGAFVLISGTLEARPEKDGAVKPHSVTEPGSVVSAMALILPKPRPIVIVAVTDSQVLFVPRHAFLKLIQQSPDLAQRAIARVQQDIGDYLGALEPVGRKMKSE